MAERHEKEVDSSNKETDKQEDFNDDTLDVVEDLVSKVKDISTLVTKARMKAKEAELRATYSLEFAERAIAEAKSAHAVSESLAKTSQVVAMLALQITNDTDYLYGNIDLEDTSLTLSETATQTKTVSVDDIGDKVTDELGISESVTHELKLDESINKEILSKFDAVYPHDLRTDDMKNNANDLTHLPVLSETELTEGVQSPSLASGGGELTDDLKRKMMLYKDSKLVKTNVNRSMETGDAGSRSYQENGTQTCQ